MLLYIQKRCFMLCTRICSYWKTLICGCCRYNQDKGSFCYHAVILLCYKDRSLFVYINVCISWMWSQSWYWFKSQMKSSIECGWDTTGWREVSFHCLSDQASAAHLPVSSVITCRIHIFHNSDIWLFYYPQLEIKDQRTGLCCSVEATGEQAFGRGTTWICSMIMHIGHNPHVGCDAVLCIYSHFKPVLCCHRGAILNVFRFV